MAMSRRVEGITLGYMGRMLVNDAKAGRIDRIDRPVLMFEQHIIHRLAAAALVLLAVSFVTYLMLNAVPATWRLPSLAIALRRSS